MIPWRVAKSLDQLLDQWNAAHPGRSIGSDGSIGDEAHAAEGAASDHNPWVQDNGVGVVTARDFTHDPAHGADAGVLAEALKRTVDPRVKYVIWNRHIWSLARNSEGWRPYTGSNPHDHHVHVSVSPVKSLYDDTRPWVITLSTPTPGGPEMNAAEQAQMTRIEKGLAAMSLAVANNHAAEASQVATFSDQEAGRYRDFVARYNNIMTELAKDPDSPVTPASVLPA